MNTNTAFIESYVDPRISDIAGLSLRGFSGEGEYPNILKVIHGCGEADGLERSEKLEDVINTYTHLHNCDPYQDALFVEVNGMVIAYSRVWWEVDGSRTWVGFHFGNVIPKWRRKGIGSTLLRFNEERLGQIACQLKDSGSLPSDAPCILENFVSCTEVDRINLLKRRGYKPARYTFEMVRPNLENIPDLPLPVGMEVRLATPDHMRLIWEASNEAFQDHWGYIPDPWEEYEQMMSDPDFDPSLWRVAWQGDQIAGMVLSFINKDENEMYGRLRGYTENICVRRPWRKQGLAKALIALSLKALKERGMLEAALGVDTQNTSGALNLYKFMGYQVVKNGTIYRKPLNV
ncbi:MAG: N-acetyltransferase [Anaerolineales bacterium]|nr:GNAT family N-acetyltransferase [Anaerolineae bacterium]PWB53592.1 MAG: N-acetyltransferase [Anaerolineales bacterium]